MINPKNEKTENGYYSSNVANNVPSALAILSGIYTVIGFFGVLLMTKPKESSNKIEESIEEESSLL